ncbi:hypothetical protein ACF0H5_011158 [Mactra antiquata]
MAFLTAPCFSGVMDSSVCSKPYQEHTFCFELMELWTYDTDTDDCRIIHDCPDAYYEVGENAFFSRERCEHTCKPMAA